jgi:serine/threonine-protein kinase RsbW
MLGDQGSLPAPAGLLTWAGTLPAFAAEAVSQSNVTQPHVYTELNAVPDQVRVARAEVTGWARQVGFPADDVQDVVLAVDEAVTNSVEHAYPGVAGTLTLFAARFNPGAVRIVISDHGHWRAPPVDPGFRGRGLRMMESLAQVFRLAHTPHGTTVLLGWALPGF